MTNVPTEKAWNYFLVHKDNIREIVERFLSVDQWQSMVGPFGDKTKYTISEFDEAVVNRNTRKLESIMTDAWGRAPESRNVYLIPGFTAMCNLLDGTIEGFIDCPDEEQT